MYLYPISKLVVQLLHYGGVHIHQCINLCNVRLHEAILLLGRLVELSNQRLEHGIFTIHHPLKRLTQDLDLLLELLCLRSAQDGPPLCVELAG